MFTFPVYFLGQFFPLDPYDFQHLCNALVGLLGVVAAYKIGSLLGGRPAGVLAAFFLLLTPRYYGHAFNNPKDVPFAVCYFWAIYYLMLGLVEEPPLSGRLIWKIGVSIGLAMGIRVGGLVLLAYLGLFFAIRYIQIGKQQQIWENGRALARMAGQFLSQTGWVCLIAYGVMVVFWPRLRNARQRTDSDSDARFMV